MIPEHVTGRIEAGDAVGWLIDRFGAAHALAARTLVGRRLDADVVVLTGSVSREHAELLASTDGGWVVRDLGSRNGTMVAGEPIRGRAPLAERAAVRFGDAAFFFIGRPLALPEPGARSIETAHAPGSGAFRYGLRGASAELCVVGASGGDGTEGGAVLHRRLGAPAWSELSLPPLEFQLLRVLCARRVEEAASPARSRGCVPTRQLARLLPFQSRYANEENVRQVVRRLRATLDAVGVEDLVEVVPGRGYYLAWELEPRAV